LGVAWYRRLAWRWLARRAAIAQALGQYWCPRSQQEQMMTWTPQRAHRKIRESSIAISRRMALTGEAGPDILAL